MKRQEKRVEPTAENDEARAACIVRRKQKLREVRLRHLARLPTEEESMRDDSPGPAKQRLRCKAPCRPSSATDRLRGGVKRSKVVRRGESAKSRRKKEPNVIIESVNRFTGASLERVALPLGEEALPCLLERRLRTCVCLLERRPCPASWRGGSLWNVCLPRLLERRGHLWRGGTVFGTCFALPLGEEALSCILERRHSLWKVPFCLLERSPRPASWRGGTVFGTCCLPLGEAALSCPLERRRCLWNVVFASWRGGHVLPLGEEAQSLEHVFASWTGGMLAEASWRGGQSSRSGPEGAGVTIDKASADFEAQSKLVGVTSMFRRWRYKILPLLFISI